MSTLQDISAIARKALEDSQTTTESDIAPIYSDALDAIIELCQMEQKDLLDSLRIIASGIEQITSGVEVGLSFYQRGVVINRENTLQVLLKMARAAEKIAALVEGEDK